MARQIINVGAAPNDGTGDPIRTAYIKCNDNFGELYARAQSNPPPTLIGTSGDQAGMYAYDSNYFYFCFQNYDGSSVIWAQVTNIGNIAIPQIINGTSSVDIPALNGNVSVTVNNVSNTVVFTSSGAIVNGDLTVTGNANLSGNIVADRIVNGTTAIEIPVSDGNANITIGGIPNTVVFTATETEFAGNVLPASNITYSLGSTTNRWQDLWLSNSSIYMDQVVIGSTGNSLTINGSNVLTGNSGTFSTTGNITGGNLLTTGSVEATGNITGGNLLTAGLVSATGNVTAGNLVTLGIVSSAGNITGANLNTDIVFASGNIQTTGGLFIGNGAGLFGVVASANVGSAQKIENGSSELNVVGPGGNIVGNIAGFTNLFEFSTVGFSAQGNVTGDYFLGNAAFMSGIPVSYSNANVDAYLPVYSGNISAGNISTVGNITGAYILGNGSQLTGLPQQYGNSNVATYLPTYTGNLAGGNISVTGNVLGTNLILPANGKFQGDFSNSLANGRTVFQTTSTTTFSPTYISLLPGPTNTFDPPTAVTAWNSSSTSFNSGVSLQAYSTEARIGTIIAGLASYLPITVYSGGSEAMRILTTGNVGVANTAPDHKFSVNGNAYISNNLSAIGNISANYASVTNDLTVSGTIYGTFSGNISGNLVVPGSNTQIIFNNSGNAGASADLTFNDGTNVLTVNGTTNVTMLSASGNVTGANLVTTGLATVTGNVQGGNLRTSGLVSATGNIDSGNLRTSGLVSATGNVDSGNLRTSGLVSATGNITGGNLSVSTGTINVGNIVNTNSNGVGNIGSTGTRFNYVFALASSAQYADLAEYYLADADYAPGTVVSFGGTQEITQSDQDHDIAVAGIISDRPAYEMNAGLTGDHPKPLALAGRVRCRVKGPVRRGQMLVSAGAGRARAEDHPRMGSVIGKALQDFAGDTGTIEVVVGRL